jgi:hypothetical protein
VLIVRLSEVRGPVIGREEGGGCVLFISWLNLSVKSLRNNKYINKNSACLFDRRIEKVVRAMCTDGGAPGGDNPSYFIQIQYLYRKFIATQPCFSDFFYNISK